MLGPLGTVGAGQALQKSTGFKEAMEREPPLEGDAGGDKPNEARLDNLEGNVVDVLGEASQAPREKVEMESTTSTGICSIRPFKGEPSRAKCFLPTQLTGKYSSWGASVISNLDAENGVDCELAQETTRG